VKLENFKKKIYAVGVIDDMTSPMKEKTLDDLKDIGRNMKMIRNLVKDVKPENVLLELC
jgi:hypothetical protein